MDEQTETYAIVELFGHKTIAGRVTKSTGLFPLLRIDVPATSAAPEYTVEYGAAAIYGITYVSVEVAKATAESLKVKPINVYNPELVTREMFEKAVDGYKQEIAGLRRLPERAGAGQPFEDGDDEDDDESF